MAVYVAPLGDDGGSGTVTHPYATLARALAAMHDDDDRRIILRGGVYEDVAVTLGPAQGGITIEAAEGECPVLYGGRRITHWQPNGPCIYADLPAGWDFRLLQVNGRLCPRAGLPHTGAYTHDSSFEPPWMSTTAGGWERKPTPEELTTLTYRGDDLGPWLDLRNAELTLQHQWDMSAVGIRALDPATRTVTFTHEAGHPAGAFTERTAAARTYRVWNVREGMQPGHWYLDRTAGRVIYWPLPGEAIEDIEILAPTTESIIRLEGMPDTPITDVTVRGVTLAVANVPLLSGGFAAMECPGALALSHAAGCRLEELTIRHVAGHGISGKHCAALEITNCLLHHTGGCAVLLRTGKSNVTGNTVHHPGTLYPSAAGMMVSGDGNVISGNTLHDMPYSAIIAGGAQLRIADNRITRYMQELADGGGIYVTSCRTVTICGNRITGASTTDLPEKLAHAYYLDELTEDALVEGNVAINTGWPVLCHMSAHNTFRGNLFVDAGGSRLSFLRCRAFTLGQNIIAALGPIQLQVADGGWASTPGNLFYSATGTITCEQMDPEGYTGSGAQPFIPADGSRIADPCFTDWPAGDYTLAADSPARMLEIYLPSSLASPCPPTI